VLLSINRYERKKNIPLALKALQEVIHRHALSSGSCARCRLVVAGGYDQDVPENVEHERELKELASELGIEDRVVFLRNISDAQRCVFLWPLAVI
jgi:glycosyltransferase involved in cell wall biosynthesis